MEFFLIFAFTILAYLIGSVPFTVIYSKFKFGIDIRDHGSGTPTHANVRRVMGWQASLASRVVNTLKGLLATKLAFFAHFYGGVFTDIEYPVLMLTFGLAAILGHIFPVFTSFRGGKGIHVSLGVMLAVSPLASLICAVVAVLIYFISRYEYLGYIIGASVFPILIYFTRQLYGDMVLPLLIFGVLTFILLFVTHSPHLLNIIRGTEARGIQSKHESIGKSLFNKR